MSLNLRTFLVCLLACQNTLGQDLPSLDEAQEAVIAYRKSIVSGRFVFHSKHFENTVHKAELDTKIDARISDDMLRCDVWVRYPDQKNGDMYRRVECRNCERPGHYLIYNEMFKGSEEALTSLSLRSYDDANADKASWLTIDPRLAGLAPTNLSFIAKYDIATFVMPEDCRNISIAWDEFHGRNCWLVQYRNSADFPVRYWVDPNQGPSVVRMECDLFGGTPNEVLASMESDYSWHEKSKYWYPLRLTYAAKYRDGGSSKEEVDVEVVSINEGLRSEDFQLVGMGIEHGTRITTDEEIVGTAYWNGKEIEYDSFQDAQLKSTSFVTWLLSIGSVGMGVTAIWLVIQRRWS